MGGATVGVAPQHIVVSCGTVSTQTTASSKYVVAIYFEATKSNSGTIYIGPAGSGTASYTAALAAGSGFGVTMNTYGRTGSAQGGPEIQLNSWWAISSAAGDTVQVTYFERVGGS